MMIGPRNLIATGNSREVFLVDYEGAKLVLKTTKHQRATTLKRHHVEAIALDVVRVVSEISCCLVLMLV